MCLLVWFVFDVLARFVLVGLQLVHGCLVESFLGFSLAGSCHFHVWWARDESTDGGGDDWLVCSL